MLSDSKDKLCSQESQSLLLSLDAPPYAALDLGRKNGTHLVLGQNIRNIQNIVAL
jgi:hypothetical protein